MSREARAAGAVRGFKSGANKFEKEFFTWRGLSYAWCYHYFQQQVRKRSFIAIYI